MGDSHTVEQRVKVRLGYRRNKQAGSTYKLSSTE